MGISEMQHKLNAYGSGELPEFELRTFIRGALRNEPQLSSAFVALTDAYRRANLIDANLQSIINTDIAEVTGPNLGLTMIRSPGFESRDPDWTPARRAANSTDVNASSGGLTSPMEPMAPLTPMARSSVPKSPPKGADNKLSGLRAVPDGSWSLDAPAALTAPRSPESTAGHTGSTGGSSWDADSSLSDVATPLYPGAVIRDRFVLVEELGRGGMGVVYKAYDRSRGDVKDRYVAIKVLNEEFKRHPLAVRSLQREARKAQRLAHPNVVGVHDFDRDAGNVYMVMEFLSGRSLEQVLRDDGRGGIPLGPALDIIKCLGAALSYAHEQDIVHCDFKPSNAFLGRDGKVKVLDFGIARAAPSLLEKGDATLFDAGQLGAISPAYASLEMLQRETPDVRDDVYALACVAYELLTGVHPYQRIDAIKAYQTGLQPRPIRKLSRAQWRALKQGLEFQRAVRCPNVDALVRPLVTPPGRAKLWIAAAAGCLVVAAIAGALVWKWPDVRRVTAQAQVHLPFQSQPTQPDQTPRKSIATGDRAVSVDSTTATATTAPVAAPAPAPPAPSTATASAPAPRELAPPSAATGASPVVGVPSRPPEAASESVALPRDQSSKVDSVAAAQKQAGIEILKEQFETQAAAGDVVEASATANSLARALPGSVFVTRDVPRMLIDGYAHRARTEFAGGKVNESLQTLKEGRRKFGKSPELKDLEARYVMAADIYDRMSSAVALNVADTMRSLGELKSTEGSEYEAAAQMLAQTLADRIADQKAAGRQAVADKLLESGTQIFPDYRNILARGTAGVLQATPIIVDEK
jgi:serine/threonine protein kinase